MKKIIKMIIEEEVIKKWMKILLLEKIIVLCMLDIDGNIIFFENDKII